MATAMEAAGPPESPKRRCSPAQSSFMDSRARRPATHDEWRVHLIVFVVEAERVEHEVHAKPKGLFALLVASRDDRVRVVAEVVALVGAAEVLPRVDHRGAA